MNTVFSIHREHRQHQRASRLKTVGDHSGRFECSHCSKAFTRSEHLKRHERGHTKERPFACAYCRRAFVRKDILSRHLKSFHPDLGGPGDVVLQVAEQKSATNQSLTPVDLTTYRTNADFIPRRPASRSSGSSDSYEDSPLPTTLETTRPTNNTIDVSSQNSSIQSSQPQNQVESVSPTSDEYTPTQSPAVTATPVQHRSPLKPSANTNTHQTASSDDVGLFWTEGHQLIDNGHFPCDNGVSSSQVILDENAFDLLNRPSDGHTIPQNSAATDIQDYPPLESFTNTNTFLTTSSNDVDLFWTKGHRLIDNGHFPCDNGVGSPVILDDNAFEDSYSPLFSSSTFLQSLGIQSARNNAGPLLSDTELLRPAPKRADQAPPHPVSARKFPVPGESSHNQNASKSNAKQSSRWMNGENERGDTSEQEMPYAEKLHTQYPSICSHPDSLPTTNAFLRYIDFYFKYCSPQLPFLHQISFGIWTHLPALILSVASIGAIYAAEHETAFSLHCLSKSLLKQFEEETAFSKSKTPLEYVQAEFLNMMFAAWSGDARGVKYASSRQSSVVAVNPLYYILTLKVTHLLKDAEKEVASNIKLGRFPDSMRGYEEVKRLFYVVYIVSVAFCSALGSNPLLFNHDCLPIRLPCEEAEWSQQRASPPNALFTASVEAVTLDEALSMLSTGRTHHFGPFQLRILIAALYLEFWQAAGLSHVGVDDGRNPWKDKIKQMLRAWEECFQAGSESRQAAGTSEYGRPTPEPPLTFDALALYRHIQVELVIPLRSFGLQLRDFDAAPEDTADALWDLRNQIHRSPEMTEAMNYCLETLRIPLSKGTHFIARTGPLYWSVEHVPLGSILCVLLCLWTSRFSGSDVAPVDRMEETILRRLVDMLRDAGYRPQKQNLPSVVAEVWETMLNSSCYVWKVTPEYAKVFRSCVKVFVENRTIPYTDST